MRRDAFLAFDLLLLLVGFWCMPILDAMCVWPKLHEMHKYVTPKQKIAATN